MQPQSRQVPPSLSVFVDEGDFEAVLRGADRAGISGGTAAHHHQVEDRVCQSELRSLRCQTFYFSPQ